LTRVEPGSEADELARAVIGAAIEVHSRLGPGFLESAYEEALSVEMGLRGIPFARQVAVELGYKGTPIGSARLDFLVGRLVVVELKSVESLAPIHVVQVRSYLHATGCQLGAYCSTSMWSKCDLAGFDGSSSRDVVGQFYLAIFHEKAS
jgi:GxxExxY protein